MSLSIILDSQARPYEPSSAVRGTVFLTTAASFAIHSLKVNLTGLSQVKLTQDCSDLVVFTSYHHSQANFFQDERVLCSDGRWTHQAENCSWGFEFMIPAGTDRKCGDGPQCPFLDMRELSHGGTKRHGLPPSMLYSCHNFACQVEYVLEATLTLPAEDAPRVKTITAKAIVRVHPKGGPGLSETGWPPFIRHEQRLKASKPKLKITDHLLSSRWLKLSKDKQRSPIANSNTLAAASSISLSVLLPSKIEVRDNYSNVDIMLSTSLNRGAHPHATNSTQVAPPAATTTLRMTAMKIAIIQHTHVRAGPHTCTSTRKTYTRKTTCSVPIRVGSDINGQDLDATEGPGVVNLGKITELRIGREFLVVDFASYNIAIDHALDLEIAFEYLGKTFEFVRNGVPINVVNASIEDARQVVGEIGSGAWAVGEDTRPEETWLVPPPEENGVLQRETDAYFSQPPPRYMLRVS